MFFVENLHLRMHMFISDIVYVYALPVIDNLIINTYTLFANSLVISIIPFSSRL